MGIQMTIKDTYAVTLGDLLGQLPNSKAAKEVALLQRDAQDMFGELQKLQGILDRTLLHEEALKSVVAVLAAKANVSDEDVLMLLDVALDEAVADAPGTFPCLHGCDSIVPTYPTFRAERHVKPCPHALDEAVAEQSNGHGRRMK